MSIQTYELFPLTFFSIYSHFLEHGRDGSWYNSHRQGGKKWRCEQRGYKPQGPNSGGGKAQLCGTGLLRGRRGRKLGVEEEVWFNSLVLGGRTRGRKGGKSRGRGEVMV